MIQQTPVFASKTFVYIHVVVVVVVVEYAVGSGAICILDTTTEIDMDHV